VREKHARGDHVAQAEPATGQDLLEVFHHLPRLCFDAFRVPPTGEGKLAGHEYPAVDLDRVAERRHRSRRAFDHVKDRQAHEAS
jgi:hypothetical protein